MSIFAYINPENDIQQINELSCWDEVKYDSIIEKTFSDLKMVGENLIQLVSSNDVVITSTLTNFSLDFITAIQIVSNFDKIKVRVIALLEKFDSFSEEGKALIRSLPFMHKFRKNSFNAIRKNRIKGIKKAAEEGKYKGRQAYSIENFPNFRELYKQYMYREIGKGEFADKFGVSRPTLDKLIKEFTTTK